MLIFNIVILAVIFIGLTVHRYLSTYWQNGLLPYGFGFCSFANKFAFIYLLSFSWMFGILAGTIISALCFFQIVQSSVLWVPLTPWLVVINMRKSFPRVNPLVYGGWSYLIILLAILTVANFIVSPYKVVRQYLDHRYGLFALVSLAVIIVGNGLRILVLKIFSICFPDEESEVFSETEEE